MAFSYSFMVCGQQLATLVSIVLLIFTNSMTLSYQTVFAIVILTADVCKAFSVAIPSGIRLAIDVYTSLQRIHAFLETSYHLPRIHDCPENDPIRRPQYP